MSSEGTSEPEAPRAQIDNVVTGEGASVAVLVKYDGKEARVQLPVDASETERPAIPKLIEEEMRALVDALELIAEDRGITFPAET